MTTPTTPPPHRISAGTVVPFPCWAYSSKGWTHFHHIPMNGLFLADFTHWHPDQPEAPTARPEQWESVRQEHGALKQLVESERAIGERATLKSDEAFVIPQPAPGTPRVDADNRQYPSPEYAQHIRFEGNDCVVMHPEEYEALYELARTLERELQAAQAEVARLKKTEEILCLDWADDHTRIQQLCREAGFSEPEVTGDSYGVPGILDLAQMLKQAHAETLAKLESERQRSAELIEFIDAERAQRANQNLPYIKHLRALSGMADDLANKIASMPQDSQRLDWLEKNARAAWMTHKRDGVLRGTGWVVEWYDTLDIRAAIDAALAAQTAPTKREDVK